MAKKMVKNMRLVENHVHGLDLIVERDAGNEVQILTGNRSLAFWKDLQRLCGDAIHELYDKEAHPMIKSKVACPNEKEISKNS